MESNCEIKKVIGIRAEKILKKHHALFVFFDKCSFYIAGNGLNNVMGRSTDVDIFPLDTTLYNLIDGYFNSKEYSKSFKSITTLITKTNNAITFKHNNVVFQVCNYFHKNLYSLIASFDYAHIQVGVKITYGDLLRYHVNGVYFTEAYIANKVVGNSIYTGTEYPLSSLTRAAKYYKYGEMSRGRTIRSMIFALTDFVKRGFTDYNDFKDQLDAVDLGLLPEEFGEITTNSPLLELFELLKKDK